MLKSATKTLITSITKSVAKKKEKNQPFQEKIIQTEGDVHILKSIAIIFVRRNKRKAWGNYKLFSSLVLEIRHKNHPQWRLIKSSEVKRSIFPGDDEKSLLCFTRTFKWCDV